MIFAKVIIKARVEVLSIGFIIGDYAIRGFKFILGIAINAYDIREFVSPPPAVIPL